MTNVRYRERGSDRELETAKFHTAERVNERERGKARKWTRCEEDFHRGTQVGRERNTEE